MNLLVCCDIIGMEDWYVSVTLTQNLTESPSLSLSLSLKKEDQNFKKWRQNLLAPKQSCGADDMIVLFFSSFSLPLSPFLDDDACVKEQIFLHMTRSHRKRPCVWSDARIDRIAPIHTKRPNRRRFLDGIGHASWVGAKLRHNDHIIRLGHQLQFTEKKKRENKENGTVRTSNGQFLDYMGNIDGIGYCVSLCIQWKSFLSFLRKDYVREMGTSYLSFSLCFK